MAEEIPTFLGGLTIPELNPPVLGPEEIPELLMAMGIVGITTALINAVGALVSGMITAPVNFMVMRVALAPLLKGLVPPPPGLEK